MRIFEGFEHSGEIVRPVATIGSYDGVHAGHREILARLKRTARQRVGESTVITFHPHPRQVLHPEEPLSLLNTLPEKLDLLASLSIDNVIVVPFTMAFSRIPATDFVQDYLVHQLHVDTLIVGYNHHLGYGQTGDSSTLQHLGQQFGFRVEEMPRQSVDEQKVSSTVIRRQIAEGQMSRAARYLGAPYALRGILRRRLIEEIDTVKLLPPPGRYPVQVLFPTVGQSEIGDILIVEEDRRLQLLGVVARQASERPVTVKFP